MTGRQGRPSFTGRSDRHDDDVFFRVQAQAPQPHSRYEIRAGAKLAYTDSFAFQIAGAANRGMRDDHIIQPVAYRPNKCDFSGASRPGANGSRPGGQLNRHFFRQQRLERGDASGYEYRPQFQTVAFEGTGTVRHPEITARAAERV